METVSKSEFEEHEYFLLQELAHSKSEEVAIKITHGECSESPRGDFESSSLYPEAGDKSAVRELIERLKNLLPDTSNARRLAKGDRLQKDMSSSEDVDRRERSALPRSVWSRHVRFSDVVHVVTYGKKRRKIKPPQREIPLKSILKRRKRSWNVRQLYNLQLSMDEGFCVFYILLCLLLLLAIAGSFLFYYSQNIFFKFECCSWKLMMYVSPCVNDLSILISGIYSLLIIVLSILSFMCIIILRGKFVAYLILGSIIILGISINCCIFIFRSCGKSPEGYLLGICGRTPEGSFNNKSKTLEYDLKKNLLNCWNIIENNHNCCGWHSSEDWNGNCSNIYSRKIMEPFHGGCYEVFKKTAESFVWMMSITWLSTNFIIVLALIIMLL